jgi:hypothetical protein
MAARHATNYATCQATYGKAQKGAKAMADNTARQAMIDTLIKGGMSPEVAAATADSLFGDKAILKELGKVMVNAAKVTAEEAAAEKEKRQAAINDYASTIKAAVAGLPAIARPDGVVGFVISWQDGEAEVKVSPKVKGTASAASGVRAAPGTSDNDGSKASWLELVSEEQRNADEAEIERRVNEAETRGTAFRFKTGDKQGQFDRATATNSITHAVRARSIKAARKAAQAN